MEKKIHLVRLYLKLHLKEADFYESSLYLKDIRNLVKDIDLAEIIQTFETILHERNLKD